MNIFEKVTAVAAFLTFAALSVLVFALLLNARDAWRHRRAESAMRRERGNLLRDYWIARRKSA